FFQAEDGIRDFHVTGVQTCALPIYLPPACSCDGAALRSNQGLGTGWAKLDNPVGKVCKTSAQRSFRSVVSSLAQRLDLVALSAGETEGIDVFFLELRD